MGLRRKSSSLAFAEKFRARRGARGFPDGSLLCVNNRGKTQARHSIAKEIFRKKGAQKNEPYPQATSIVAKLSRFVKCLQQIFAKKSLIMRSREQIAKKLLHPQKIHNFFTTLCGGIYTRLLYCNQVGGKTSAEGCNHPLPCLIVAAGLA